MFSKYEGIADITLLSRNMLGKSMNSIPLLINGILMKCLMWLINRINVRTKSMLSITSSKESCFIQIMFSIIKFIRLII